MARAVTTSKNSQVDKLKRANEQLKAENTALKTKLKNNPPRQNVLSRSWRRIVIIVCIALATTVLIIANILFWAGGTLVNTNKYVATVTPLMQNSSIQTAIATYTTDQLFSNYNVAGLVQDALPPKAEFLAPTLVPQLQNATQKTLEKALASEKFQTVWVNANTKAHEKLISAIKNSNGDGVVNLQDVYNQLSKNLEGTKLSFLTNKSLPSNIGQITVINAPWVPTARKVVNNINWLKPVALAVVILFSGLAIWLSEKKRKMVILLGIFFSVSSFLLLVALRVSRSIIVSHVASTYQTAANQAVQIIYKPLVLQTTTLLLLGILIAIIAWVGGQTKRAIAARRRIDALFSGKVHESIFGKHESIFTAWVGKNKRYLQWGSITVIAIIMLFVTLSPKAVLLYAILMLLCAGVVEIVAQPSKIKS